MGIAWRVSTQRMERRARGGTKPSEQSELNWIEFHLIIGLEIIIIYMFERRKCDIHLPIIKLKLWKCRIHCANVCILFAWGANTRTARTDSWICLHFTQLVCNVCWTDYTHCRSVIKSNAICIIAFYHTQMWYISAVNRWWKKHTAHTPNVRTQFKHTITRTNIVYQLISSS